MRVTALIDLPPFGAAILKNEMGNATIRKEIARRGNAHLKPGLHLGVGHLERLGECGPFCRCQVFLFVKSFFELANLHSSERGAGFFALWRCPVLVWVADAASRQGSVSWSKWKGHCREREVSELFK